MRIVIFAILALPFFTGAQTAYFNWDHEMIEVIQPDKSGILMDATPLFSDKWNELDQPQFWKKIMLLSPDSCLINLASNRRVLATMSIKEWHSQSEIQKSIYKNELKALHGIDSNETVFVTTGKNDFYQFQKVYPSIAKGILAFERYGVDPWYAQAILLIESPGKLAKSSAGAYGAFQLMPGVARAQGLTVNNTIDERKDFDRSAYGASRLIQRVCIPEAKKILDAHDLNYSESDLWFRLFVLHVYHAGAMNVKAVVNKINPTEGGQKLITSMWHTSAASFGNSSQNYTQLALASQLILHEMVQGNCVKLFHCFDETSIK